MIETVLGKHLHLFRQNRDDGAKSYSNQQQEQKRVPEKPQESNEPDTVTDEEKAIYSRNYLMKFQNVSCRSFELI